MGNQNLAAETSVNAASSTIPSYSFQLENKTGLPTANFKVQILGYSVASKLYLQKDSSSSLKWDTFPSSFVQELATTKDSDIITTNSVSPFTRISVGDAVTGTGIPANTSAIGLGVDITLEQAASETGTQDLYVNMVMMVGGNVKLVPIQLPI